MKRSILIAEDDAMLRGLYAKKFSYAGYEIRTAADGEEALKMLSEQKPDLFICDIRMPKVDGFGVLEKWPRSSRTFPIIVLTNFDQEDYRKRGEELGMDGYFVKKNMTIHSLLDMAETLLRMREDSGGDHKPLG
ncbi:MAG: response regulator [Candidatus Peregrinibacteria bacterium]|nr:response regulator [Candidatus Peregrinibacteria bacterium]